MRGENGLAISMILHVIFLLILYFNFSIQLFIPKSRHEMLSVDNIYNEGYYFSKHGISPNKREKEQVSHLKDTIRENIVHDFPDSDTSIDQMNMSNTEDEAKFSSNKVRQTSKEIFSSEVHDDVLDKKLDVKTTNKNNKSQGLSPPSIDKDSILRPNRKYKVILPRLGKVNSQKILFQNAIGVVRKKIIDNWNIPPDFKKFKKLRIRIRFQLKQNGLVLGNIKVEAVGGTELIRRILKENARKAVIKSQPFKIPSDSYNSLRNINLLFIPSKM
ncbi:cell envelope integrity protein TolA [Candidatus Liberibacter brunswickensis]|uniref:cell envelope integrity protein TolA n=1 Tax=Candidatus Liberibacter brunswickensis TaxID=1968796 RepID=UPI002FE1D3B6